MKIRKIASLILTVVITASVIPQIAAVPAMAAVSGEDGIISLLKELEIMQGDENGNMGLDRQVSRAEFAKLAVAASAAKNTVAVGLKLSPYKDVPYTKWHAPYVKAAVSAGYVQGYLDATYRPDNNVTYEEAVTVMLRVLGYSDGEFGAAYPYGQLAKAQGLDMLDNVGANIGDALTRRQVMYLIYNTLQASVASGANTAQFAGQLLSVHDCVMTENADVISTYAQDSSLGSDKVFTSAGTYTKGDYFNDKSVGMTGKVFIRNSRDIVAFVPDAGYAGNDYETYFVYSTLANSVVGYNGGKFETIDIPDATTVYKNQSPTNYAAVKNSLQMGDTLYVKRTGGGSVDYITYASSTMEGPHKVVSENWVSSVGADSSSVVMRDGVRSSTGAVLTNDIIYYSAPLNMVFAYSNKVTGVYESASPTKDSPSRVTVSGIEYSVEGVDAFNSLSSSGSFNYGDTVTLCLGKDGGAAGVVTSASSSLSQVVGYVTSSGIKMFTDSSGKEYSANYVTLVSPDGSVGTYETSADRKTTVGSVCTLSFTNGKAHVSRISSSSGVSGRVSYAEKKIGDNTLAANVNILDVSNDNAYDLVLYKKIYTQRIDGLSLTSSQVLYSEKNAMGEVTTLILNNVTGDVYTYGAVNTSHNGTYQIDINGTSLTYQTAFTKDYRGAVKLYTDGAKLSGIVDLPSYGSGISRLTETTALIGGTEYKLSADVVCYVKSVSTFYRKIPLEEAIKGNYSKTAYYDKPEANGGRIRIIVCNE